LQTLDSFAIGPVNGRHLISAIQLGKLGRADAAGHVYRGTWSANSSGIGGRISSSATVVSSSGARRANREGVPAGANHRDLVIPIHLTVDRMVVACLSDKRLQ
jgi:hypothetical protein